MRISDWSSDVCSSDLLFPEMPRHLLVDALEQRIERLVEAVAEDTVFLGLLLRRTHLFGEVEVHRRLPQRCEIGRAPSELQSLMRISYAVFCLKKNKKKK